MPLWTMARWNSPSANGLTEQVEDADGAGRLAEDGDVLGVAAEGGDVLLHPLERRDLIEEAVVAHESVGRLSRQGGVGQEAQRAQPVVDGDYHHTLLRQLGPVVDGHGARPRLEAAAMDPEHHGQGGRSIILSLHRRRGRPHVQIEAILAGLTYGQIEGLSLRWLRAGRAESDAGALVGPRRHGLRRLPAQVAHRRGRVGDALEDPQVPLLDPRDRTAIQLDPLQTEPVVAATGQTDRAGPQQNDQGEQRCHGPQ